MKKIIVFIFISALFAGCSFGNKRIDETKSIVQPTDYNNEEGGKSVNTKLYETEKFSFEYPAAWEKKKYGDNLFDTGSDGYTFQVYDGEVMGPRCAKTVNEKTFTDASGKKWYYHVDMPSKTEICDEPTATQQKERTAISDVAQQNSGFLALLFFTYDVENETAALKQFETILSSAKVK